MPPLADALVGVVLLLALFASRHVNEPIDGMMYGSFAGLGAAQNTLQGSISNIENRAENLSAANSRIRDTDVAAETANFTRSQILMQAGVSVLAQANQAPQGVLSLLR